MLHISFAGTLEMMFESISLVQLSDMIRLPDYSNDGGPATAGNLRCHSHAPSLEQCILTLSV